MTTLLQLTHSGHIFAVYAAASQKAVSGQNRRKDVVKTGLRETTMSDKPKADAAKTDAKKPAV